MKIDKPVVIVRKNIDARLGKEDDPAAIEFENECSALMKQDYQMVDSHTIYIPEKGSCCDQYIVLIAIFKKNWLCSWSKSEGEQNGH